MNQKRQSSKKVSSRQSKVNIRRLKTFAFTEMPKEWVLREIILAESEEMDIPTFLAFLRVWLQLSKIKGGADK